jgi:glycerol-3-phosphate dehydrogenase
LFLNAPVALEMAPEVARLMSKELGQSESWQKSQIRDFRQIAACFLIDPIK